MTPRIEPDRRRRAPLRALLFGAASAAAALLGACSSGGETAVPAGPDAFSGSAAEAEAVRFLAAASFGASPAEVGAVLALGPEGWIDAQLGAPPSALMPTLLQLGCAAELPADDWCPAPYPFAQRDLRDALWWENVTFGADQLRQRVAFALSQILVASEKNVVLFPRPLLMADYWDLLVEQAFGDYRTLLEEVTLHPAMGAYLSMCKNRAADPVLGTKPDENYAREVMQLFTIGLVELNPDGTPRLDGAGHPIATYDQGLIVEVARVLTGWTFASDLGPSDDLAAFLELPAKLAAMEPWPAFHDTGEKQLPGGGFAPAGLSPEDDLDLLLDALAEHPNVGPFVSRRLIQHLTTSNPSPAYVGRISAVWADDGAGLRGNLGAVVRAILLDPEAGWREPDGGAAATPLDPSPAPGKLREPILRVTALWRGFEAEPAPYPLDDAPPFPGDESLAQQALASPSVFNFFSPDHSTAALADQGLVAPELQIATHDAVTSVSNELERLIGLGNQQVVDPDWRLPRIDLAPLVAVADDVPALVDAIDLRLTGGRLGAEARAILHDHLSGIPYDLPASAPGYRRATRGLSLAAIAPQGALQR